MFAKFFSMKKTFSGTKSSFKLNVSHSTNQIEILYSTTANPIFAVA